MRPFLFLLAFAIVVGIGSMCWRYLPAIKPKPREDKDLKRHVNRTRYDGDGPKTW